MINRTSVVIWSMLLVLVPVVAFAMGPGEEAIVSMPIYFYYGFAASATGLLGQGYWIVRYMKSVDDRFAAINKQMSIGSGNVQIIADKITKIGAEHDMITKNGARIASTHDC